ncbi:hypothetical protein [Paenibacillus sp. BK720]|uniref:hypothetical protein n=1 Tax=Paenibacillus sp. BK720 TaxID=2587092 RepID=UPI00141FC84D|nr:hypothetical protein [Paenibacillus sp. BK720]NIK70789.1 hypothetical protein [Paenibacillus sp. BK720]
MKSDPDWYKSLQGDILKEQKFDNELIQKIRLRTTQLGVVPAKNRLRQATFASLASLIVVVAILFTVSETAMHSSISQQNTNITEGEHLGGQATSEEIEKLSELTDTDGEQLPGAVDLSEVSTTPGRIDLTMVNDSIHLPLNLADPSLHHTHTSSSALQITKLVDAHGQISLNGETILVIYQLNDDKHEVIFTQSRNKFEDVQAAVEDTKSWYKSEDVKVMEINGCTAVIEDSPSRKQVHLITAAHFYTIGSPGTLDLEYLITLAGKIQSP